MITNTSCASSFFLLWTNKNETILTSNEDHFVSKKKSNEDHSKSSFKIKEIKKVKIFLNLCNQVLKSVENIVLM